MFSSPVRHENIFGSLEHFRIDGLFVERPELFRPFRQRAVQVDVPDLPDLVPVELRQVRPDGRLPVVAVAGHVPVRKVELPEVGQLLPERPGFLRLADADELGPFALGPFLFGTIDLYLVAE